MKFGGICGSGSSSTTMSVVWFVVLFVSSGIVFDDDVLLVDASDVQTQCETYPGLSYGKIGSTDETNLNAYKSSTNYMLGVGSTLTFYSYQRNATGTYEAQYAYDTGENAADYYWAVDSGYLSTQYPTKNDGDTYGYGVYTKANWNTKIDQFATRTNKPPIVMVPGIKVALDAIYDDDNLDYHMKKRAQSNKQINGRDVFGINFDGLLQHDMTFTLSDLNTDEIASWRTYHKGVKQQDGTITGTNSFTELTVVDALGFDVIEFYIAEEHMDVTDMDKISYQFQMIEYCLPTSCDATSMDIAKVSGDPHIDSFDGLHWDCMAGGLFQAFVGTKQDETKFEIQTIFDKKTSQFGHDISLTRAVAIDTGDPDQPIITVSVPDDNINGCPYTVHDSGIGIIQTTTANPFSTDQVMLKVKEPSGTQQFQALEFSYLVTHTEVDITVSSSDTIGCFLNVAVCLGQDYWRLSEEGKTTSVTGLMGGQADNITSNDWQKKDGGVETIPVDPLGSQEAYNFCVENWCISDPTQSKFDYSVLNRTFEQDNQCNEAGVDSTDFFANIESNPLMETEVTICQSLYGVSGTIENNEDWLTECYTEAANDGVEGIVNFAEGQAELTQTTLGEGIVDDIYAAGGARVLPTETTSAVNDAIEGEDGSVVTTGGVNGDPHFKTWSGVRYDYHGICDLMLINHPGFSRGVGMEIHVRSKKTKQWSYISTASIRIGSEILEISGIKDGNSHWLNMVEIEEDTWEKNDVTVEGYPVYYQKLHENQREYIIDLGNDETIKVRTWKDMVRVDIINPREETFAGSLGLMGSYPQGDLLGRDGITVFTDLNNFGQEWQVLSYEPNIFHIVDDGPQHPQRCELPSKTAMRRNLAQSKICRGDAEIACGHVMTTTEEEFDLCVFDVMAIGDESVASAY